MLATDGVEEAELTAPTQALHRAGAQAVLVSPKPGRIQSMKGDVNASDTKEVDMTVADARPGDFDGLVLPGGTTAPDTLLLDAGAVASVKAFVDADKPIAAISTARGC